MKTLAHYLKTLPVVEHDSIAEGAKRKITALQTVCWKSDHRAELVGQEPGVSGIQRIAKAAR